jgi:D-alanyl-D-alanine carboxypeptidase
MKKFYLVILTLVLNVSLACAESPLKGKVEAAIEQYISTHFLNATYMFCHGDDTLAMGAHGIRSLKTNVPLKENEQMPVASITKSMTAASILKLQDKKLLNVQDVVSKHLTAKSGIWADNKVPSWADKVTIHNLLTHRSGLPEYFMNAKLDVTKSHDQINKDIANFAGSAELAFEPGSKFAYNNTNFVLLGLIIEQVSGSPLADFYDKELFIPLNMKSTRLISLEEAVKSQTDPDYTQVPTRYFVTPNGTTTPVFNEAKSEFIMVPFSDGGVISTNGDLIRWHKALHNGKVLSDESYKLMTTKYYEISGTNGIKTYMGYGLFISTLWDGCDTYYHAGNALAIRGESGYVPTHNFYYAVLSNTMNYVPKDMEDKIDMSTPANQLDIYYFVNSILQAIK